MKKIIVLISAIVLVLAFALTGCGTEAVLYRTDARWSDGEIITYNVTSKETAEENKDMWVLIGEDVYTDAETAGTMTTTITKLVEKTDETPEKWQLRTSFSFKGKYMKVTDTETLQSEEKTFTINTICEVESMQPGRGFFIPTMSERTINIFTVESEKKDQAGFVELKERNYRMTADYTEKDSAGNYKNTIRSTINEWGGTAYDKQITDFSELTKTLPQEFTRTFNPSNIVDNEMLIFAPRTIDLTTSIPTINVFNTLETNTYLISFGKFKDTTDSETNLTPITVNKDDGLTETFNCSTYQFTRNGTIGIPIKLWIENDYKFVVTQGAISRRNRNILVKMEQDNFVYTLSSHNYEVDEDGLSSIKNN